jgi:hypothetical protein
MTFPTQYLIADILTQKQDIIPIYSDVKISYYDAILYSLIKLNNYKIS